MAWLEVPRKRSSTSAKYASAGDLAITDGRFAGARRITRLADMNTRYIGVLDLVTVYLANLLMPHCYPLIDFGSYGSRTLVSRLASLSEAHMTYSKHKQRDTNSLASSGFWTGTRTRARKRLQSCSSTLDTLACHH